MCCHTTNARLSTPFTVDHVPVGIDSPGATLALWPFNFISMRVCPVEPCHLLIRICHKATRSVPTYIPKNLMWLWQRCCDGAELITRLDSHGLRCDGIGFHANGMPFACTASKYQWFKSAN